MAGVVREIAGIAVGAMAGSFVSQAGEDWLGVAVCVEGAVGIDVEESSAWEAAEEQEEEKGVSRKSHIQ